ncbi:glycosyl hydrolase family 32 [Microbacterium sp. IEGM 1404]|uniref:glycosyl hydrolase family 32 n=1 Tax=Microbacterium sp. IEGM 1404 TaxID=3047084 RepID=UPI0027E312D0|nr:glycosyl hydrolase family 32 [Microbacterium sp. IEGM 1404]
MTFTLPDHWVWDFWLARDGDTHHMLFLQAPISLGDPDLRHRNATVGHATSSDLRSWTVHGTVLEPTGGEAPDATATWTGSIVEAAAGWRMFYTGSRFLEPGRITNVETVLAATSDDLTEWVKDPGVVVAADPRWYETLAAGTWHEEAWRDPWVFADPDGDGWHMLVTARAVDGPGRDRGVVGHAWSPDLVRWEVRPPRSTAGAGFAHLEVPQVVQVEGRWALVFSCDSAHLAGHREGERGGIWAVALDDPRGPYDVRRATLVAPENLYSGRIAEDADGRPVLLAFENVAADGAFIGTLSDPLPVRWDGDRLVVTEDLR